MSVNQYNFRGRLQDVAKGTITLNQKLSAITTLISSVLKQDSTLRIRYVAGRVTSDGQDFISQNLIKLNIYTDKLENMYGQYVFSAADVFPDETYWKKNITTKELKYIYIDFWQKILKNGITDMYMSPGWETSNGATFEHEFAQKNGIEVHYPI
ncbi:MAG: DUF4406 domain-containing protein [Candidatus Gottesmanbacteria bacterium]|nr:DUF4406 domain-containing protein [Candidatus Gottesmanbacteria bacterium]